MDPGCAYRPICGPQDLATREGRHVHSLERAHGPSLPGSWALGLPLSLTASLGTFVAQPELGCAPWKVSEQRLPPWEIEVRKAPG